MSEDLKKKNSEIEEPPKRPYNLLCAIIMFFLLYIFQGLFFGSMNALKLELKEKGASYGQIAILSIVSSVSYLKMMIAPFIDFNYSKRIGKRTTWIVIGSVAVFFFKKKQKLDSMFLYGSILEYSKLDRQSVLIFYILWNVCFMLVCLGTRHCNRWTG